jgi:hypothetical protein
MTHKDYVALAEAIRLAREYRDILTAGEMADRIAGNVSNACMIDNPRFDPDRFRDACGLA